MSAAPSHHSRSQTRTEQELLQASGSDPRAESTGCNFIFAKKYKEYLDE